MKDESLRRVLRAAVEDWFMDFATERKLIDLASDRFDIFKT